MGNKLILPLVVLLAVTCGTLSVQFQLNEWVSGKPLRDAFSK